MPNLAALRAAIFLLSAKNRWGGTYVPPPPAVRGLTRYTYSGSESLTFQQLVSFMSADQPSPEPPVSPAVSSPEPGRASGAGFVSPGRGTMSFGGSSWPPPPPPPPGDRPRPYLPAGHRPGWSGSALGGGQLTRPGHQNARGGDLTGRWTLSRSERSRRGQRPVEPAGFDTSERCRKWSFFTGEGERPLVLRCTAVQEKHGDDLGLKNPAESFEVFTLEQYFARFLRFCGNRADDFVDNLPLKEYAPEESRSLTTFYTFPVDILRIFPKLVWLF